MLVPLPAGRCRGALSGLPVGGCLGQAQSRFIQPGGPIRSYGARGSGGAESSSGGEAGWSGPGELGGMVGYGAVEPRSGGGGGLPGVGYGVVDSPVVGAGPGGAQDGGGGPPAAAGPAAWAAVSR